MEKKTISRWDSDGRISEGAEIWAQSSRMVKMQTSEEAIRNIPDKE